jgi:hypothetical protein
MNLFYKGANMLKRSFMIVTLLSGMVPMAAVAGNITTRVMTAGGSATMVGVDAKYIGQTNATGPVTKNYFSRGSYYDTSGVLVPQVDTGTTVTFAPLNTGYSVAEVAVNGVKQSAAVLAAGAVAVPAAKKAQSVTVKFARLSVAVTTHIAAGGSVVPSGTKSAVVGTPVSYKFTPNNHPSATTGDPVYDNKVQSITTLPAGAVLTDATTGAALTVANFPYAGPVKVTFTPAAGVNVDMTPSFLAITASAGNLQTVSAGTSVTLKATSSDASATFAWAQLDGPFLGTPAVKNAAGFITTAAVPWSATGANVPQLLTAVGNYTFQVTATSGLGSATSIVLVKAVSGAVAVVTPTALASTQCENCHSAQGVGAGIFAKYTSSIHGQSTHSTCSACHVGTFTGSHPGTVNYKSVNNSTFVTTTGVNGLADGALFCTTCHGIPHATNFAAGVTCVQCHTSDNGTGGTGDAHEIKGLSCQGCHSVVQTNPFNGTTLVSDNNSGVRAVTGEFQKWSHHIVNAPGVAIADEQCAVCHLEGTVGMYGFGVDGNKHMKDNVIHLRNVQDDTKEFAWNPATPDHTVMDNFCMTCHSAAGATSAMSVKLQTLITAATGTTASALNPFGDTISNKYDKMKRPAVTNVKDQFKITNNSHHGVSGARYAKRTRIANASDLRAMTAAESAAFAINSSATLQGVRSTIYDAGNFNALYVPLGTDGTAATSLGDDSTLHCGDCHTVGQYKAGVAQAFTIDPATGNTVVDTAVTTPTIGAHGSNNEYMLRNFNGSDVRHTQNAYTLNASTNVVTMTNPSGAYLVCYNCHAYKNYGSVFIGTGADAGNAAGNPLSNIQSHAGEYASAGRCNGPGNTLSFAGYTTGKATDGTQFMPRNGGFSPKAAGEQAPDSNKMGDIFGIQCLNCHNSGLGNAYGGIHGSANNTDTTVTTVAAIAAANSVVITGGAYVDGMGNVTKNQRFLPGLGDAMHTPGTLGGFVGGSVVGGKVTGGISNDTNWEQKVWNQTATTVINFTTAGVTNTANAGAGCYTLGSSTAAASKLIGPSVTGPAGAATAGLNTWGGCTDHSAAQGGGDHGFLKRIVRPVTY